MINYWSGVCKKLIFDEQFLIISRKRSLLRLIILTQHVCTGKKSRKKPTVQWLTMQCQGYKGNLLCKSLCVTCLWRSYTGLQFVRFLQAYCAQNMVWMILLVAGANLAPDLPCVVMHQAKGDDQCNLC